MPRNNPLLTKRRLGGFDIAATRTSELIDHLQGRRDAGLVTELYFANSNFVTKCYPLAEALNSPESVIVNDGFAIDVASLMFHGRSFAENLNGTDFAPRFLGQLRHPTSVFLLGARPSTVSRAAERLGRLEHISIVGAVDGYEGLQDDAALLQKLRDTRPDILLVALGNPLQEEWIVAHRGKHEVALVMAVGALLDFLSGNIPRAPSLIQRLKLEWLYRLMHEPRRLMGRYTVDMLKFFVQCLRTHWRRSPPRKPRTS